MKYTGRRDFHNHLDEFTNNYNNSIHRSHGFRPIEVNSGNEAQVYVNLYKDKPFKATVSPKFKVADKVYTKKLAKTFSKGYRQNWDEEIFEIYRVKSSNPHQFYLQDSDGNKIFGGVYAEDLLRVD